MNLRKNLKTSISFLLLCVQLSVAADLSPAKWPREERMRAEQVEQSSARPEARLIEGRSGLVSATLSPISVRAGIETLKHGGTAADAAGTVALTQIATALGSYVSYAGIMQLLYYDANSRKVYSMNAGWMSYVGETDPKTIPGADLSILTGTQVPTEGAQGRKTLVPGFMQGIEAMHKRFGKLRFSDLFQPAIWYAENGVRISPLLAGSFITREKYLSRTAEGRRFMYQSGKGTPKIGDRFVQSDLATTLRSVAKEGASHMYTGAWGRKFVNAVRSEGGKATVADMKRYRPIWEKPLNTSFRGHTIYAPGMSNASGIQILEALNLVEELKLDQKEPYWKDWTSFLSVSRILEVVQLGVYSPEALKVTTRRGSSLSPQDLTTKAFAREVAPMIGEVSSPTGKPAPSNHSDSIVVIDRWGNIAVLVHSINTVLWGTTGIVVGGIPIADALGFKQAQLAALKAGDRLPNDAAPVLAMTGSTPTLAVATIGSSLAPETVRVLMGILGNGLSAQTVMKAPPLLLNFDPQKSGHMFVPEGEYDASFLDSLKSTGVKVELKSAFQTLAVRGTAVVGILDRKSGTRQSVETPQVFGFAAAYTLEAPSPSRRR